MELNTPDEMRGRLALRRPFRRRSDDDARFTSTIAIYESRGWVEDRH